MAMKSSCIVVTLSGTDRDDLGQRRGEPAARLRNQLSFNPKSFIALSRRIRRLS